MIDFSDNQSGIGTSKTKRIGKYGIQLFFCGLADDIKTFGELVRMLQVDIGGDEATLHHQDAVDNLAGTRHPAFVARHRLGG